MGGKSGQTIGYRYKHLFFDIWAEHVDTMHRFVAGAKLAWSGCVHDNQTLQIDAPDIWGGDDAEGGVVGPMDVQFGGDDQGANARLATYLGPDQTGNRGFFSTVFEGIFGSYIPNPKTRSVLLERIHAGWPGGAAWYPETAAIPLVEGTEGSPGVPGSGAGGVDFYNMGLRVTSVYSGVDKQNEHTLEMCQYYALTYTETADYYAFWRPNESGLYYIKFSGESNATAVLDLVSRGWAVDEVALCKFNSGDLLACVVRLSTEAPWAPAGRGWTMDETPYSTDLGTVYLFMTELGAPGVEPVPPVEGICAPRAMNPAHITRYMLTQKMLIPDAMLSEASFTYAADVLFAEGFGLCEVFDPDGETPEDFIQRICDMIGANCTQSRSDGLIYLDLLRNDYDIETLPEITDDDILTWNDEPAVPAELANSVQIEWRDVLVDGGLDRITPPAKALGHIRTTGQEKNQVITWRGIPFEGIANRVCKRELDARSKPLRRFPNVTTLRKHASLRPGQPLVLRCPKFGVVDMVVRVGEIDIGTPADAKIVWTWLQDIFNLPDTVEVDSTSPVPGGTDPTDAEAEMVMESPYVELVSALTSDQLAAVGEESGYLLTSVAPASRGTNYGIYSKLDGEAYDERRATADFTPTALTLGAMLPLDGAVQLVDDVLLDRVEIGSWVSINDEIMRVDGISESKVLSVGRSCADTVPQEHAAGSRVFFSGNWNGSDRREYAVGDELLVKLPVRTSSEEQDLADVQEHALTFQQRQFRPYPPAGLQINGQPFYTSGSVVTSPPGGGGGVGGGGTPTSPPKIGPSGVPLSPSPGPNGGFPDDNEYPIPQPTTVDTDIMPGGGFSDPEDLALWRKQDGTALGADWSLVDGELTYSGADGAAYCYGIRLSLPIMPFPRYSIEVTAKIRTTRGMLARFGVGWGSEKVPVYIDADAGVSDLLETGTDYPEQTLVTHVFEIPVTQAAQHGSRKYAVITFMPAVEFVSESFSTSLGKVDDVTMTVTRLVPAATALTPDHLNFDSGLTGWALYPDITGNPYAPTMSVSGGEVTMAGNSSYCDELCLICQDPITDDFEVGKYFGMGGEVLCNDPTLFGSDTGGWVNAGGVTFGYAVKRLDGTYARQYGGMAERGDWTDREIWMRCMSDITNLPPGWTIHALVLMAVSPGYVTKVRNLWCKVTDEVID